MRPPFSRVTSIPRVGVPPCALAPLPATISSFQTPAWYPICQLRTKERANSLNTSSAHTRLATRRATGIEMATSATDTTSSMAPSTVQPPSKAASRSSFCCNDDHKYSRLSAPIAPSIEEGGRYKTDVTLNPPRILPTSESPRGDAYR